MHFSAMFRVQGDGLPTADVLVTSSDPAELFNDAVERALRKQNGDNVLEQRENGLSQFDPTWKWLGQSEEDRLEFVDLEWHLTGDGLTIGLVDRFLGEEASTSHPQFLITYSGRGGDAFDWTSSLVNFLIGTPTVYGVLTGAITARRTLVRALNRTNQQLFAEWRDNGKGEVPMKLEQAVRADSYWEHEIFKIRFGASDDSAAELLRLLDYRPGSGSPRYWYENPERW